jgi:hypothetical protein
MIIYHGGTDVVNTPRIIRQFMGRDFGSGFYATSIYEQAAKWAIRQARIRRKDKAILNTYELDESAFRMLKVMKFDDYVMEWLDFVVSCRRNADYSHEYDIVIGKIANDDVGETIQAVIDGLTSKEFALNKLAFMFANDQICFSTDRALSYINFISSERVN